MNTIRQAVDAILFPPKQSEYNPAKYQANSLRTISRMGVKAGKVGACYRTQFDNPR